MSTTITPPLTISAADKTSSSLRFPRPQLISLKNVSNVYYVLKTDGEIKKYFKDEKCAKFCRNNINLPPFHENDDRLYWKRIRILEPYILVP